MLFQFSPHIQAGLAAGIYDQVYSGGVPIGVVRWAKGTANAGHFAGNAVGILSNSGAVLNPLAAIPQMAMSAGQMYQMHRGFQAVQASLGVLQATTVVIGIGTFAGVALIAVNLWQTLKLREDVKQLKLEVKNGFIDLKKALKDQGSEIIQRIDEVAQDIKFEQHRLVLIRAYGKFLEATKLMKTAMVCEDLSIRNATLASAQLMLTEALADYNNPQLLSETCAAGQLRRLECAWTIDQTITLSFQLQNQLAAVSDRLSSLQDKIRQDSLTVIERCETEDELDFLFPELIRIHDHDLAVLESWQNHVDWMRSLPPSELKLLQSADFDNPEVTANPDINADTTALTAPPEQLLYENLKQKSHPASLQDQLVLMMKPSLRQEFASYISEQSAIAGYKTLVPANLQNASNLAVANLYWYFKVRDESEDDVEAEAVTA
ncbi:hypothetical protein [Allocoleopsis franciscana]|uniref:Uncharacterized protein n=1 Tax=Allocoleopsis franciscana PCC 7113 TaxID=1173027 RepID=K9W896_9CYAN|nr:hypothetical protein [Allocoleopsis franciscana]AFZ16585.1 hypothetical protein Mic7113_0672 [Allocoleopsis franciscana PCC 7113]